MSEIQSTQESKASNATQAPSPGPEAPASSSSVVATLCGVGTVWAEAGIGYGRLALENSAKALERTAQRLGSLQAKLRKPEAPAESAPQG